MKKVRRVVVNDSLKVEMVDVRTNAVREWRFGDLEHLERLCNNLSTEANYKELWDYVVIKPKCDDLIGDHFLPEAKAIFQNTMLPVLLPVIGYSHIHIPRLKAIEELPQLINEMGFGSSSIPLNFVRGPSISQFLHLVRFIGIRYPDLAQGLSRLNRKEWREIEESACEDGFEFKKTDYRQYTHGKRKCNLLLPVWIRHRLAHPENEFEEDFPTESDYRRAFAILGAAIAGRTYSDTNDIGNS